jgi:outer membrane autotransporter protein
MKTLILTTLVLSMAFAVRRAEAIGIQCPYVYSPNAIFLCPPSVATDPNSSGVAGALSAVRFTATGDMLTVINQINAMGAAQQRDTFSHMGAAPFAALPGVSLPGSTAQTGAVTNRLAALRSGTETDNALAYGNVKGEQWYPGVSLADGIGDTNAGLLADRSSKLGFYGSLLGSIGRQYGDFGAPGYAFNGEGFSLGADYRLSDAAAIGVSAGFIRSHASVDEGGGTTDGSSFKYGVYGTAARDGWYADAYFGGGLDYFSTQRQIIALGRTAASNPQAHEFNMKLGVGYDQKAGAFVVTPFASLSHDEMNVGSFGEDGAGAVDLNVDGRMTKSTKMTLGFRVKRGGDARVKPYVSLAYQHEAEGEDHTLTSAFTGGGQTFTTTLATPSAEAALVGVGLEALMAKNVTARASYDGEYRPGYVSHSLNGNVRLKF